jgi:hypothetical protein
MRGRYRAFVEYRLEQLEYGGERPSRKWGGGFGRSFGNHLGVSIGPVKDGRDLPAGDPFWLVIATREIVQTTGGSLIISKGHYESTADLHGLENKHDELVVDSLLFVKDTLP